jgi:hypothetical protein
MLPLPYSGDIEILADRYEDLEQLYAELAEEAEGSEEEDGVAS